MVITALSLNSNKKIMPSKKLKEYLDRNEVPYVSITHSQAYTAQQIAASAHIPGRNMVKTVMVVINGTMAMAVLPASFFVDFNLLKEVTGEGNVRLASEMEFKDMFPDCEVGAMPPFGNIYNLAVYVAKVLTEEGEIAFNAGTHTEIIQMTYRDFERLVHPMVMKFAVH
jgi:Ala-tRNA(Pro) deacylase